MASEVELMAKNPKGGCFAKVHDVFTLTCSAYNEVDTDIPSSAAANSNNKAFSSFKTPSEVPTAPGVGGRVRLPQVSSASTYAESRGSEPIQDGPPTPLRYLARPKHVHAEIPYSANSIPSLSLAVGLSTAYKEDFEQEDEERTKLSSPSLFLGKSGRGPQSVLKPESSDAPRGMPKMSLSKMVTIQQPNVYQHIPMLTNISQAFSPVNSAFNLQSSRAIPQIVPMTVNTVSSNTRQPLQCEDPLQGVEKFKIPACTTSQFSFSTSNGNRLEALNYMNMLQTPSMSGFGGQQLIKNEGNLSLGNNCQEIGGKRKLVSQMKPVVHTTARSAEHMSKGFLEAMDGAENDGHCHKKKQLKLIKPPNDKTENLKLVNGFSGLQSRNRVGKLGNFAESLSLKLNSNDAINTSVSLVPYSTKSNMQGYSHSELGKTSDLALALDAAAAKVLIKQSTMGNIEGQNLDGQSCALGIKPLTFPAYAPMPAAVSTFSSGGPTVPQNTMQQGSYRDSHISKRESSQKTPSFDLEWGKFLALSPTPDPSLLEHEGKTETLLPYQKRFIELQAFLKRCDEPDQEYLKTLRSFSAAARSEHAVDLESRAIMLSLKEVQEIKRMKMLDVFAKNLQNRAADEAGTTRQGSQLPAIVSTKAHKLVSNP